MSILVTPVTTRVDLVIPAGQELDLFVPILDALDNPVEITAAGDWSARAQVRPHWRSSTVLFEWTTSGGSPNAAIVAGTPGAVRLQASSLLTAGWQTSWAGLAAAWDLDVVAPVDPDIPEITEPRTYRIAEGRIRLSTEITR